MNLQFYLEKLNSSEEFRKFIKENPEAYICSAFFIRDKSGNNKSCIDFYIPASENSKEKIVSFQLDEGVKINHLNEKFSENAKKPEKVLATSEINFDSIEEMICKEMESRGIKNKIQKIIMVLQNKDKKDYWICTVFISGLGLLNVNIELSGSSSGKITFFEKKSFFDILGITGKSK